MGKGTEDLSTFIYADHVAILLDYTRLKEGSACVHHQKGYDNVSQQTGYGMSLCYTR